jgi:hypothetical protein
MGNYGRGSLSLLGHFHRILMDLYSVQVFAEETGAIAALKPVSHCNITTPWLWSASELCRPSDRRLLAK